MSDEKGFLTQVDRDFLLGEKEYTGENAKQQRYERREAIAARTRQAFRDFSLLYETLDGHERDRIFDVGKGEDDRQALSEFQDALIDTIAFLYHALEGEVGSGVLYHRSFRTPFKAILQSGVRKGEIGRHPQELYKSMIGVEFDVSVTSGELIDVDRAIEKIIELREYELTEAEVRALIRGFDPDLGIHGRGWGELEKRVRARRKELGIERVSADEE